VHLSGQGHRPEFFFPYSFLIVLSRFADFPYRRLSLPKSRANDLAGIQRSGLVQNRYRLREFFPGRFDVIWMRSNQLDQSHKRLLFEQPARRQVQDISESTKDGRHEERLNQQTVVLLYDARRKTEACR
jgi:hypothetical protein